MNCTPKSSLILALFMLLWLPTIAQQQGPEKWTASVAPNPSEGIIRITLAGKYDELTHVNIVDANGKSIYTENVWNDRTHTIDLTSAPKGTYTILMMSTNIYMRQGLVLY